MNDPIPQKNAPAYRQTKALKHMSDLVERAATHGMIPPQAVDFEQSLLGAIMIDKGSAAVALSCIGERDIDSSPFYRDAHKLIYAAMQELQRKQEPIDLLTVTNNLRTKGELDSVGGPSYLVELTIQVVTTVNVHNHALVILQKHMARRTIQACEEAKLRLFADEDVFDITDELDQEIMRTREQKGRKGLVHASRVWDQLKREITTPPKLGQKTIMTGLRDLDELSGGFVRGEQSIIAALSSRGKTAFAVQIIRAALDSGQGVAVFTLETLADRILLRMLIAETGLDKSELMGGRPSNQEWLDLYKQIDEQKKLPLYIDDSGARTPFDIRSELRRIGAEGKIGLVVVDYLQLVSGSGRFDTREQEVTAVSRQMRAIWKEFNVAGIALAQFNRQASDNREPSLGTLRESGAIEQDARKVFFIHYPYRKEGENIPQEIETVSIIVAKNDGGPVGKVEVDFHKRLCRFTEHGSTLDSIALRKRNVAVETQESEGAF